MRYEAVLAYGYIRALTSMHNNNLNLIFGWSFSSFREVCHSGWCNSLPIFKLEWALALEISTPTELMDAKLVKVWRSCEPRSSINVWGKLVYIEDQHLMIVFDTVSFDVFLKNVRRIYESIHLPSARLVNNRGT